MKQNKIKLTKKEINVRFNIIAIICICIFAVGIVGKTLQNDTYYTITLGKYILNNGIDMMEHFSWHEGLIYTYPHWLYDIFIYIIYNAFGFFGIYVSTIVLTAILGISIYIVASKLSKNNLISLFVTLLVLFLGKDYMTARAQLVTFILFVWTIYFIENFLDTKKVKYIIGLIIIPIIIANVHAAVFPFYFILYLPYIGEYVIALITENGNLLFKLFIKVDKNRINKLLKKSNITEKETKEIEKLKDRIEKNEEKETKRIKAIEDKKGKEYKIIVNKRDNVKWLILVMIVCAFTGLLTPIGDTPYTYLIHTMQGNTTGNINEHLPLVLANSLNACIIFGAYIVILTFTKTKIRLSDLFLALGLIVLSFKTRRQVSMVLFISVFAFNNILVNWINNKNTEKEIYEIKEYFTTILGRILIFTVIALLTVTMLIKSKNNKIVNESQYPVAACDYILENLDIKNIKLFNDYNYGSYLMFRGIPVFIDSRADVYDPKFNGLKDDIFQDYINLSGLNCYYEDKFEHYGITHVMAYANSKLALYISKDSNYKEIYKDKSFVIYEKQ